MCFDTFLTLYPRQFQHPPTLLRPTFSKTPDSIGHRIVWLRLNGFENDRKLITEKFIDRRLSSLGLTPNDPKTPKPPQWVAKREAPRLLAENISH